MPRKSGGGALILPSIRRPIVSVCYELVTIAQCHTNMSTVDVLYYVGGVASCSVAIVCSKVPAKLVATGSANLFHLALPNDLN
jgi:hypothetical protein